MNTPKQSLALGLLMATSLGAMAIPATPNPVTVTQPDGMTLTIRMVGDENGVMMFTEDGRPVMQDPATGRYEIVASMPKRRVAKAKARPQKRVKISNYPTIGVQKALIILVEFADTKFTAMPNPYDYYDRMLNEEGFVWEKNGANGSARDYYIASSDGLFQPDFTVVGPVTLEHDLQYYGGDTFEFLDENAIEMVIEAATALDSQIDYTEFDADGDGYVDNIYFFYAGYGQADSGKNDAIWPHAGQLEMNWGRELVLDGMRIDHYACSNEIRGNTAPDVKPVGIGTFVHEFGHVLGIADHYDTRYSSGRIGVNDWDTMAAASYHNNQNTPPLFNAFERAELGWLEYTDICPDEAGWLELPALDIENKAYRVVVNGTDGKEYFVLENRRKQGWDSYLPGEGMLVWHVDMDEPRWWDNTINNDPVHQCFDLVEADGRESEATYSSDPFPGKSNVTQFSFMNWAGTETFRLDHIRQADGIAYLLLGNTSFSPEKPEILINRIGGQTLSFSWTPVANAQCYQVRLEDESGKALEAFDNDIYAEPTLVTIESLTPESNYRLGISTIMGSYRSQSSWTDIRTSGIMLFEMTPIFNNAEGVGQDKFSITWQPLDGAKDYEVTLESLLYSEMTESTCNFIEVEEPWSTSNLKFNKALYGAASPSLQLDNDGDWLAFTTDEGKISNLSFWVRSQSSSNSFRVEAMDTVSGKWAPVAEEVVGSGAKTLSFEIPESPAVRIIFGKVSGYLLIDDVACSWQPAEWGSISPYERVLTAGACLFNPTGLQEETEYRVSLRGTDGTEQSKPAYKRVRTTSVSGVDEVNGNGKELYVFYDLLGNRVAEDTKGIIIRVYTDGTVHKTFNR